MMMIIITILLIILISLTIKLILQITLTSKNKAVGIFHPFTNDGGGGERVLWCAVKAVQDLRPDLPCVVYTGDHDATSETLARRAVDRFGVELISPPKVVHLHKRKWIEEKTYPRFTMIGQSLGSVYLAWEALNKFVPMYYLDTSGYAFTYPLARLFGCKVICYTHYPTISLDMLSRVHSRSSMYNNDAFVANRKWIEEKTYPRFTMIGQSLGSVYLAWEALNKFVPMYYLDTSGYAFTYPLARLFGCKVICYTHYPTISLDMLSRVHSRSSMYNNDAFVANSVLLSRFKLVYYTFFSWMYGFVGSCANLAMVNSSWTQSHIEKLWGIPDRIKRVYPPCDTTGLQALPLERESTPPKIISVAQFRPEKLQAFALSIKKLNSDVPRPKLQFVGSCRNDADEARLQSLKDLAIELKVEDDVEFYKNVTYRELVKLLGGATAGIHSMIDEHFGISVVEYMAAGAIPIAHNSAGPKMDIVLPEEGKQTGFLAQTVEEFADAILKILRMSESEKHEMAEAGRRRANKFSEQRFYEDFKAAISPILN